MNVVRPLTSRQLEVASLNRRDMVIICVAVVICEIAVCGVACWAFLGG